jgi:uncharacterized membrane protein YoaK (UPF0700 family)
LFAALPGNAAFENGRTNRLNNTKAGPPVGFAPPVSNVGVAVAQAFRHVLKGHLNSAESSAKDCSQVKTKIQQRHRRTKAAVALGLTFAAGFVDIVGLLAIYKIFTAHVTGTTVRLGEQLVRGNWSAAAVAATVVLSFILGSIAGRVMIEVGSRGAIGRIASVTLSLEIALLICVAWWGNHALVRETVNTALAVTCSLLSMLAAAMGLQTATLTRVGPLTIHTTFVTGMINKLGELVSSWIFLNYDVGHKPAGAGRPQLRKERSTVAGQVIFILAIWFSYLGGAICGTWLGLRWQAKALYLPCTILLLAIVVDQVRPLALEEEKEQSLIEKPSA